MNRILFALGLAASLVWSAQPIAQAERALKPAKRPVILMTDCGTDMDDQWAIAHLALSPQVDLRGIITTHAFFMPKPEAEYAARVAKDVLDHLPLKKLPPIFPGSSVGLADKTKPLPNAGVDFLLKQSRGFSPKKRLAVLTIGAATDLASALLTDPTLADRIEIIAMAYYNWPDGGDEWNVKNDPKAWQVLLESQAPIAVGDQAVCKRDLAMNTERARKLFAERGPEGRYIAEIFTDWMVKHPDLAKNDWPVWDEVTTAHLLGLTKTQVQPRPTLDDAMRFVHPSQPNGRVITWITALDTARLWDDFTTQLDRARKK